MTGIIDHPSPNHEPRKGGRKPDMLVIHYTGMTQGALERLCDPAARVSSHYLIGEDGTIWRLVDEDRRAWHAGVSAWGGETDINSASIGIELDHPGHEFGYRPFAPAQIAALKSLAAGIMARHGIPPARVLAHSDVAPARKSDPGELFPWAELARAGIGLWPGRRRLTDWWPARLATLQKLLVAVGYDCPTHGRLDDATRAVLLAFQRHYRQERLTGRPDCGTLATLRALARDGAAPAPRPAPRPAPQSP